MEKDFNNFNKTLQNSSKNLHNSKFSELLVLDSESKGSDDKGSQETLLKSVRFLDEQQQDLWFDFKCYLTKCNQSHGSIRDKISYGKRYYHLLETKNAAELLVLSPDKKSHAMKALAALSKFLGKYDVWVDMIKKFQLKWSSNNKSIEVFKLIFNVDNQGNNLDMMLKWTREVISILPTDYQNIILFNTLTGLRPEEAQKAIWLIKTKENEYIDKDRGIARHYLYPHDFLRQTKNAYISIINEDIIKIARETPNKEHYYPSLRKRISIKNEFRMNMYYCRKIFATFLRNKGIEPEIVDLLQGRIPKSIFLRHYYRPDINEIITKKIRPVLESLRNEIIG